MIRSDTWTYGPRQSQSKLCSTRREHSRPNMQVHTMPCTICLPHTAHCWVQHQDNPTTWSQRRHCACVLHNSSHPAHPAEETPAVKQTSKQKRYKACLLPHQPEGYQPTLCTFTRPEAHGQPHIQYTSAMLRSSTVQVASKSHACRHDESCPTSARQGSHLGRQPPEPCKSCTSSLVRPTVSCAHS